MTQSPKYIATLRESFNIGGYGASWALDCREMQIAQSNAGHIYTEIQRRMNEGTWEQPVQQNKEDGKIEENPPTPNNQGNKTMETKLHKLYRTNEGWLLPIILISSYIVSMYVLIKIAI